MTAHRMPRRRFGKTELAMPVLSCGGMRYQQAWQDIDPKDLDRKVQDNVEAIVRHAVDAGINHIETARGYGSSEYQLGFVLPKFPRESIIVQTKIGPQADADAFRRVFDTSLANLQLDYVDLLGIHGINTMDVLKQALTGGSLDACRKLQDEGLVKHVGFSTHGPLDAILAAIESDEFSYANVHWYYFDQQNWPAIEAATARDMGLFIISPSDKGGKLYEPPDKLASLCRPLTPMGFNDLFCLSRPQVHTLSIGAARPSDFDAHLDVLPHLDRAEPLVDVIDRRLRSALAGALGADWAEHWNEGLPATVAAPADFPLYHVLRLYNMAKAYGMVEFGRMRYNLLGAGGHWFPGCKVDAIDLDALPAALPGYRFADRLPDILREAHILFDVEQQKRLSQS